MTSFQNTQRKALPAHIRQGLLLFSLAYLCVIVLSYVFFRGDIRKQHHNLAAASAKAIFDTTMAIRGWNAGHGGVYVPISPQLQPNPYLEDPLRDQTTSNGLKLTKVNPAFMTRLLGETIAKRSGINIHITSLNPIRPENGPDPWEAKALRIYAENGLPSQEIIRNGGQAYFRYLEGMRVEKPCLVCHAKQGYQLGDVRGGISVTMPYGNYENAACSEQRNLLLLHSLFLVLGLAMLWLVGWRLLVSAAALDQSLTRVKTLEGLLPICSFCKKIRTAGGDPMVPDNWHAIENYISDRTDTSFSHSICPECLDKHYPEK